MKKKAIIVDLDDTFFDSCMLKQYIPKDKLDRKGWDEFAKHYNECTVNYWCLELVKRFTDDYKIIFLTSREDRFNVKIGTYLSIMEHLPFTNDYTVIMREENDFRAAKEVKLDLYNKYIKDYYDILFVVDDEKSNIKMFKKLGLICLEVH